ncbi:unnamed protein product, partial [Phyllotreta striolata]
VEQFKTSTTLLVSTGESNNLVSSVESCTTFLRKILKFEMKLSMLRLLTFTVIAVITLQGNWVLAATNPANDELMRELLKLDKAYSFVSRPSLRNGPIVSESRPRIVQRAMLKLQELDKIFSERSRPRFGKRTYVNSQYAPYMYEGQNQLTDSDLNDWLSDTR